MGTKETDEERKQRTKEMNRLADRRKKEGVRNKSFGTHQPFYHYRLHVPRVSKLCSGALAPLGAFLSSIFTTYPPELFDVPSSIRCSSVSFEHLLDIHDGKDERIFTLTRAAMQSSPYKSAHDKVQLHFLDNDENTLTTETPVWATEKECIFVGIANEIGNTPGACKYAALTGHVDLIRVVDGLVWVLDYKPVTGWSKTEHPACQTLLYATLLSIRSGVPLDWFRCGWFNETDYKCFAPRSLDCGSIKAVSTQKGFPGQNLAE